MESKKRKVISEDNIHYLLHQKKIQVKKFRVMEETKITLCKMYKSMYVIAKTIE